MKKLIEAKRKAFLKYLEEIRGYSDLTIKSYDESIREAFLDVEITQESKHILFNLMPYRIKISSLNPKTISKKLSAIRSFAGYLNDNGIAVILKADDSIKVAKTLPKPISHEHIIEALSHGEIEERLVVTLLYTLGLRISELASLKIDDISDEWVRVIGKGNKQRDVPLLLHSKKLLDEYLSKSSQKKFVFEKNDEKLSENSLRYIVIKVFRRVGLKVSPHQLRHSFASQLLNGSAPIADVSELLGHSSMATTQIYTKLGSALKQQNYNMAHPLCGVKEL
ncbi:MAG: integrase [Sulfurimonas sp. RIFCSPHIGHO2_12_FULL_36_9]|uniref:tyrosine-type recombinase/integrase n=1 Tax=unclassified Sulfurimonas TaxID=2623549 RepID=UPI0008BA0408|nr:MULTISPECIES: tyrosine-type recombinase/integrase [unclassified Sulfurimonas]OHD99328.1 MAG: integrase [Sulfurimonas sp. RIFCSPHIGHO2_12_FULL_36_9]OHD99610.1 MAG: integrase [Sulfurimonas sp. RIFCSPLOWO2_02_FULL_36_28]OHE01393.1 MAG: integrase [Sulfurimonas sp. RIFCSPLOWO2_12_36_12]